MVTSRGQLLICIFLVKCCVSVFFFFFFKFVLVFVSTRCVTSNLTSQFSPMLEVGILAQLVIFNYP